MKFNFLENFIKKQKQKQKTMIRLKSAVGSGDYIYLNAELIGHIYVSEKDGFTIVGVVSHSTGGFKVMETPQQIVNLINEQKEK